jgi:acetolactate synthase-1/2/3 large subunit
MVKVFNSSVDDKKSLHNVGFQSSQLADDGFDYSKVIVKKPWGYEYLIFQNEHVGAWILYLKYQAQTSMHCHPNKKTTLAVLQGGVKCIGLSRTESLSAGEAVMIDKAVFHRSISTSESGTFILEIETPVNKKDLVRLKDEYGRENLGYEGEEHYSKNIQNYNYLSFSSAELKHNFQKRFGDCSLIFTKIENVENFIKLIEDNLGNLFCCLNKDIYSIDDKIQASTGDAVLANDLIEIEFGHQICGLELMIIKKSDSLIKVSDLIAQHISANQGDAFLVPGEANIHMVDSIGRQERLNYVAFSGEKSASLAAEAYSKFTGKTPTLIVSSGASSVNAIPGVVSAWSDGVPMLILSGQAHTTFCKNNLLSLNGNKSINIVRIVKPFTKNAKTLLDPAKIGMELKKAFHLANSGRPGPVWIDIPIDVQGMECELQLINLSDSEIEAKNSDAVNIETSIDIIFDLLAKSERPVLLVGSGVRIAGSAEGLQLVAKELQIPILLTRSGADLLPENDPFYYGRPGAYGQRAANFIIQNSDLVISIGSRLSMPTTGRNVFSFARKALKVVISDDQSIIDSLVVEPDYSFVVSYKEFLSALVQKTSSKRLKYSNWISQCNDWRDYFKNIYGNDLRIETDGCIYALNVIKKLNVILNSGDAVVSDGGLSLIYMVLACEIKPGQRLISTTGLESLGIALPGAIGVAIGNKIGNTICLCETSSIDLHAQDLQLIKSLNLPIKILLFNGKRQSLLRGIQKDYFGKRYVGTDQAKPTANNLSLELARLYDFSVYKIHELKELDSVLSMWYDSRGPAICEIEIEDDYEFLPKPGFLIKEDQTWLARPLEDQYPFLPREELIRNMIIPLDDE